MPEIKGIDVSRWNGKIDWKTVANYGMGFAILRITRKVSELNIVGADVNELAPMLDPSGVSTATACKVVREPLLAVAK